MQTYKIASEQGTASCESTANLDLLLTSRSQGDRAGTPSLWHVKVVSFLYHLGEVGEGGKGKEEKQQSPNMYRNPQVICSSSNKHLLCTYCMPDTMLLAVN